MRIMVEALSKHETVSAAYSPEDDEFILVAWCGKRFKKLYLLTDALREHGEATVKRYVFGCGAAWSSTCRFALEEV